MRRPSWFTIGLTLAAALGVLRWFDVHPIELPVTDAEREGARLVQEGPADALLVVDHAAIARSAAVESYDRLDLSYGWTNVLRQELGAFALRDVGELSAADLTAARVIIVTGSAVDCAPLDGLHEFVRSGGTLVLERPSSRWTEIAGATVGVAQQANAITSIALPDAALPDTEPTGVGFLSEIREAPLPTTFAPLTPSAVDAATHVFVDDAPAWTSRRVGDGIVHVTGLDVGRLVTSLQQGVPDRGGFAVTNRYTEQLSPYLQTCDMVADPRLLDTDTPYADLLERLVLHLIEMDGPLPRWWAFPDAAPGAYVATHDEESMGDVAGWMADAERDWGFPGSDFVIAGRKLTPEGAERMKGDDRTLALHYVRSLDSGAPRHEIGVWRALPFVRRHSLAEQVAAFEKLAGFSPTSNRNHYLLWGSTWAGEFRRFAAAGIELDTTYGPDVDSRGYLFGTGQPFGVLDRNGLPLPIDELPLLTAEDLGGADREFLFGLLRNSAERHHQTVTTLFHPNVFLWRPDAAIYRQWRDAFTEAERLGLWITHVDALREHEAARRTSALRSTWSDGVLTIEFDAAADGLTIAVPSLNAGLTVHRIALNGDASVERRETAYVGSSRTLVVVPRGAHRLVVEYVSGEVPR